MMMCQRSREIKAKSKSIAKKETSDKTNIRIAKGNTKPIGQKSKKTEAPIKRVRKTSDVKIKRDAT